MKEVDATRYAYRFDMLIDSAVKQEGVMWNIGWGLTSKCNLECSFCYSITARHAANDIEDFSITKDFIDDNFHLVNSVNYGTGENSLCDVWPRVLMYVNKEFPRVVQGVTTNGYLGELCGNSSRTLEAVVDCLEEVDVSLDFGSKEKHNKFRNNPFVYDWAIKTFELCNKLRKRSTLVFLGTNETLKTSNINSLFELAQKYGSVVRLNLFRPTFGINEQTKKFIPDFEIIQKTLEYICVNYKILKISDPLFSAIFTHGNYPCADPSGVSSVRILPDGSITPSTYLISHEFKKLNIRMKNAFEQLNKEGFKSLIDRSTPEECIGCQYEATCQGGAFDRRYLWYGDFSKKDPYCPFEAGKNINISKLRITEDANFKSIHDGYLPTLFFCN